MKTVILKGLDRRGKSRVAAHGSEFIMKSEPQDVALWGKNMVLFESVSKTFRIGTELTTWSGWLSLGKEVEIVEERC